MPLRWKILHEDKLVHVVGDGPVTREDLEAHFDAVVVAGAMGYARLFDASNIEPVYDDDDVMLMGARFSAYYTSLFVAGPLAVIGQSAETLMAFRRLVNVSPSERPAAFFKSETGARCWLAAQAKRRN